MSGDTGNRTVFMLGIAGMGLAVAMFADGIKKSNPRSISDNKTEHNQVKEQVPEIVDSKPEKRKEEPEVEDVESQQMEHESEPEPIGEEEETIKKDTEELIEQDMQEQIKNPPDSYLNYFKKQKELEEIQRIKNLPDYSYKGDGSRWDKKKYFIMEAYRRSREMTPVCPTLIAKAQVDNVLQDDDTTYSDSDESCLSGDYTDESDDEKVSNYEMELYAEAKKASEERKIRRRNEKVMNMV